jgi:hypothetical protein
MPRCRFESAKTAERYCIVMRGARGTQCWRPRSRVLRWLICEPRATCSIRLDGSLRQIAIAMSPVLTCTTLCDTHPRSSSPLSRSSRQKLAAEPPHLPYEVRPRRLLAVPRGQGPGGAVAGVSRDRGIRQRAAPCRGNGSPRRRASNQRWSSEPDTSSRPAPAHPRRPRSVRRLCRPRPA